MPCRRVYVPVMLGLCAAAASAQANAVPGLDLRLEATWAIAAFQRAGSYPNGRSAIGAWTTCCNPGTVAIPFQAAMNPAHGFIHYLVAREANGRLEQISDWSYVKHTFGSNNDPSTCGSCAGPGRFSWVEIGCSDTYANSQAVDHFNLGPPEEIDPWLGAWNPQCSHFDRGEPPVAPSQLCDSIRSLDHNQASVLNQTVVHQVQVRDADFQTAGARFWWQAGYLVPAEAEAVRADNIGSREFFATWTGSAWSLAEGPTMLPGTILQRWSGASITSGTNGADDGRLYVAVRVTGPVQGLYHYEYAVHNRDNHRGVGAFRVPICADARALNFGFHDVDANPLDDWIGSKQGSELVWSGTANPLHWNSIFNFWVDTDAAPGTAVVALDQLAPGPGAPTVAFAATAPVGLFAQHLGAGCGSNGAPRLFADGAPARATLGNASFTLRAAGNPTGAACGFVLTTTPGTLALGGGCTLYSLGFPGLLPPFMTIADGAGVAHMPLPVPTDPAFEGIDLDFQAANITASGAYLGAFDLSNGLRVRVGTAIAGCP